MLERIIADYGFYMGWSFGITALLMVLEPIVINIQHKSIMKRLRRMIRVSLAEQ